MNQQVKRKIVSSFSLETILIGREDTPYYSLRGSPYPVLTVPKLLFLKLKNNGSEKELKAQQTQLQKRGLIQVNGVPLYSIDETKTTIPKLLDKLKALENIIHIGITEEVKSDQTSILIVDRTIQVVLRPDISEADAIALLRKFKLKEITFVKPISKEQEKLGKTYSCELPIEQFIGTTSQDLFKKVYFDKNVLYVNQFFRIYENNFL